MTYFIIGVTWLCMWIVQAQNLTSILAKTKRNLSRDIQSYGESSLVLPYSDSTKTYYEPKHINTYQVRPLALVDLSQPVKVIEPKVAAQQVLYEFQQTPTDAVSNVHVKQLFQPDLKPPPPSNPQTLMASETVVPVQQYPQNSGPQNFNVKQHPLYSIQPSFLEPKKYVYGKIIVDSTHPQQSNYHHPGSPNVFYSNQPFLPQGAQHGKPILNYVNHFPRHNNIMLTTTEIPPITQHNKFRPPSKNQYQTIDMPSQNVQEEKPKRRPVEKPVVENEDDDERDDRSNYQDEDEREEYDTPFGKYFEEEEEISEYGHHENLEEDDDEAEEDNKRGSSKHVPKREKHPKKYKKTKSYHSKYTIPEDKYFRNEGSKQHKSYKYKHSKKSKFPKSELDARFSEPIPVTHKKKVLKEKWFLSKSLADKERYDQES
ncbi:uncharacterized protein [Diabrotica undecimpunctata]|uniref:uncharacterized protein n=1 Tax=Diabrotica undecimpunctata TaxID=50387 RepID=UPI003B636D77